MSFASSRRAQGEEAELASSARAADECGPARAGCVGCGGFRFGRWRRGNEARGRAAAPVAACRRKGARRPRPRRARSNPLSLSCKRRASELDALLARLDGEPGQLEQVEERLFALRAAARKYHVAWTRSTGLRLDHRSRSSHRLVRAANPLRPLKRRSSARVHVLQERAASLSAARGEGREAPRSRRRSGARPAEARQRALSRRADAAAEADPDAHGLERVAFEIATIEGAAFGGLAKIASGGELARFRARAQGCARRSKSAGRARVRRGGPRRRRRRGRGRGRTAAAAGGDDAGASGHPFAAGRCACGQALPHRARPRTRPACASFHRMNVSRSSRGCSRARK